MGGWGCYGPYKVEGHTNLMEPSIISVDFIEFKRRYQLANPKVPAAGIVAAYEAMISDLDTVVFDTIQNGVPPSME